VNGSTQSIALSVSGLPAGVTGAFSPAAVPAGGSATLTLTAGTTAAAATAAFTVAGASSSTWHDASAAVTINPGRSPLQLQNGVPVTSLSGPSSSQSGLFVAVPAGVATLTVAMSGGTGDADLYVDLYVRAGSRPTLAAFDCRPYVSGNGETCTFTKPVAGSWFIMLNGFTAYSGVTLEATYAADTSIVLTNGVPVAGLSGASLSEQSFRLTVPARSRSRSPPAAAPATRVYTSAGAPNRRPQSGIAGRSSTGPTRPARSRAPSRATTS
jgi:hypothetical protein